MGEDVEKQRLGQGINRKESLEKGGQKEGYCKYHISDYKKSIPESKNKRLLISLLHSAIS